MFKGLVLAAAALIAGSSLAEEKIVDRSKLSAEAYSTSVSKKKVEPTLIGGVPANPADWPASVYASMGNSRCSATVIGERTLLIASHCVSNGGSASFAAGANAYSAVCSHAPGYPANSTYDWTLCLINRKVEGVPYERLSLVGAGLAVGTTLRLTGYGCTRSNGSGGNDGVFRIGTAPIVQMPSGSSNADIVTRGSAALCYGDSGGAVYLEGSGGDRAIVGNNSRGNISTTSYLPWVGHAQSVAFIKSWSTAKAQKICGVHGDAAGCRGGGPSPSPSPSPDPTNCKAQFADYEVAKAAADGKLLTLKACVNK